jgi:hypothetical protein
MKIATPVVFRMLSIFSYFSKLLEHQINAKIAVKV